LSGRYQFPLRQDDAPATVQGSVAEPSPAVQSGLTEDEHCVLKF
jgi:hypothetical protein